MIRSKIKGNPWAVLLIMGCVVTITVIAGIRITVISRINADPRLDYLQKNTAHVEIRYVDINGTVTGEKAIKLARRFVELAKLHGIPFQTGMQRNDSADGWITFYDKNQQCITNIFLYGSELSYRTDEQLVFTLYGGGYSVFEDAMVSALHAAEPSPELPAKDR